MDSRITQEFEDYVLNGKPVEEMSIEELDDRIDFILGKMEDAHCEIARLKQQNAKIQARRRAK